MKHSYVLLVCTSISAVASAQYIPFPDSAAMWVNTFYTVYPVPPPAAYVLQSVDNICVNGTDTVINSMLYTQVRHCGGAYKGGWRDDGGRVYYVPADSTQEFLLYDFTLVGGDEADVYFESNGQGNLAHVMVGSTTTTTEYGGTRKLVQLDGATWIEGIGATWGLFTEPWVNISNYELRLECMSHVDSIHFPAWEAGPGVCSEWHVGVNEAPSAAGVAVFPNPTDGRVQVAMPGYPSPLRWELRDAQGRLAVVPSKTSRAGLQLDLSGVAEGLYFLHVASTQGNTTERIMKAAGAGPGVK